MMRVASRPCLIKAPDGVKHDETIGSATILDTALP